MSAGLKRGGETQRQRQIPFPQSFLYISLFYVSLNKGIFRQDYKTGVYLYLSTRHRATPMAANGSADGAGQHVLRTNSHSAVLGWCAMCRGRSLPGSRYCAVHQPTAHDKRRSVAALLRTRESR